MLFLFKGEVSTPIPREGVIELTHINHIVDAVDAENAISKIKEYYKKKGKSLEKVHFCNQIIS